MRCRKYGLLVFTFLLLCSVIYIFYLDFRSSEKLLTVAMLNVGQGDAIFIESPGGVQVLVDAGPPRKVLGELAQVMPFFDRTLDAIIISNPDQDHIGGFADVLRAYKVGMVLEPGTVNDSKSYQNLKMQIKNKKIPNILAKKGMRLDLGGGAVLDILFPDRDVSFWDRNFGSIVARLTYGETSVMLTGDSTTETERVLLEDNSKIALDVDILKVGHHGSRTSTGYNFTKVVSPKYALISSGKDNNYGHPHPDVLSMLEDFGVEILRTDLLGTIIFSCDRMGLCEINK